MNKHIDFQQYFENKIGELKPIGPHKYWEHLTTILLRGKKLRSSFVILLWENYSPKKEIPVDLINDLVALELIHTSTLIHDDIIDRGFYRRNIATINKKFGDEIALLTGNLIKDIALKISTHQNSNILNQISYDVNLGQFWERLAREHASINLNHYFSIILFKTSKIFIHAADIFLSYANIGLNKSEKHFIATMAMLYQIADDIIDFQNPVQKDKSIGQDNKNNVHSFFFASIDDKLDEIAHQDGVYYTEEIHFIRKYVDKLKTKYPFNGCFKELNKTEQVVFLKELCEQVKFDIEQHSVNGSLMKVLFIYLEKILASISHLQLK